MKKKFFPANLVIFLYIKKGIKKALLYASAIQQSVLYNAILYTELSLHGFH